MSSNRFDAEFSSAIHCLAMELSKESQVYFISRPYSIKDLLKGKVNLPFYKKIKMLLGLSIYTEVPKYSNLVSVTPPITLSINWLAPGRLYDFFQAMNDGVLYRCIRRLMIKEEVDQYVYLNSYNPFYAGTLPERLKPLMCIYQSRDDISQNAYTAKHGVCLERRAANSADLCLGTSQVLTKKLKTYNSNSYILPNAADVDLFNKALDELIDCPDDVKNMNGNVIGYTGNLDDDRIDYQLLLKIAEKFSDDTILIVGPINSAKYYDVGLNNLENVLCVGVKNINELPNYLAQIDVALIPFNTNKLTESIYPLKINEYLAAGNSVVSTNFSKDILSFQEVVKVAGSDNEFLIAIEEAIVSKNDIVARDKRLELSKENTWGKRVEYLRALISQNIC